MFGGALEFLFISLATFFSPLSPYWSCEALISAVAFHLSASPRFRILVPLSVFVYSKTGGVRVHPTNWSHAVVCLSQHLLRKSCYSPWIRPAVRDTSLWLIIDPMNNSPPSPGSSPGFGSTWSAWTCWAHPMSPDRKSRAATIGTHGPILDDVPCLHHLSLSAWLRENLTLSLSTGAFSSNSKLGALPELLDATSKTEKRRRGDDF